MPDLTPEEVEEATYRGNKRALLEQEARLRPDPSRTLREAFTEGDSPRAVRARRRQNTDHLGGGDDGDGDQ